MRKIMTGVNTVVALGKPGRGGVTQATLSKDGMIELTKLLEASGDI